MDEKIENMLYRINLIKDSDPFNKRILNDAYETLQDTFEELKRLRMHNNQLMNVIYQNQGMIEDGK